MIETKDVSEWICIRDCQDETGIIRKRDIVYHTGPVIDCVTCEGNGKGKNEGKDDYTGKPCRKCSGTGRGIPSHHFKPYDAAAEKLVQKVKAEEDVGKVEALRAEIQAIGGAYDPGWGVERLEAIIAQRKKTEGEPVREAFKPYVDRAEATAKAIELSLKLDGRMSLKNINEAIKEKMENGGNVDSDS